MDDMDDDARYPPTSYPSNPRRPHLQPHSSNSASLHRSRPSHRSYLAPHPAPPDLLSRRYPDDDDEEEDDENVDHRHLEDDDDDQEDEDDSRRDRPVQGGCDEDGDDDSSMESRGKRRRVDKFAHGFEFAQRAPPLAAAAAPSKIPPPTRSLPADWSEDSTFKLLEAWGDRYVQNGCKSLRSDEWNEVSKIVSQASRISRSDAQCRNRLDTLKKKYKKEKMRLGEHGNLSSSWVYFKKMDALMFSPSPPPSVGRRQQQRQQPPRLPCGVDAGEYVCGDSSFHRKNGNDEMRDSPGDTETDDDDEDDADDSDGLPPRSNDASRSSGSSYKMLADSIQKFGKIYEKMENNKRQQMAELERMRKDFQRDLEVQKRQILERAQVEIARISEEVEYEEEEEMLDEDEDDDDNDDENGGGGGSAENLSGDSVQNSRPLKQNCLNRTLFSLI